jgi:pimeloyl-ACP methyl ester carboxylesterase
MSKWLVIVALALLSACAAPKRQAAPYNDPLIYDPGVVTEAETVVIMVPGAMTSVRMFTPALAWSERPGYALAFYRYPGMEGLPLDRDLDIETAASQIAGFANSLPGKRIRLMGYSTGGPIVILAAQQIEGDVKAAALNPAVELAGGFDTLSRIATDVVEAVVRARSTRTDEVWLQYYRTLLVGREAARKPLPTTVIPQPSPDAPATVQLPQPGLPGAQSRDIRGWRLPEDIRPMPDRLRFFVGREDPVFATRQTLAFARKLGGPQVRAYPGSGHLIYLTAPQVFDDILRWFEAE